VGVGGGPPLFWFINIAFEGYIWFPLWFPLFGSLYSPPYSSLYGSLHGYLYGSLYGSLGSLEGTIEYVLSNSSQKPSKGIRALMEQSLLLIVVVAEYDFNTESIVMNSVRL
jgi:hypothetical protein